MATNTKTKKQLDAAYSVWIKSVALAFFGEAQRTVPVKSGNLAASASLKKTSLSGNNKEIVLTYTSPYAYRLNEGGEKGGLLGGASPSDFPWTSKIRKHPRKNLVNKKFVDAHTKTYKKYYKPTKIGDEWSAINYKSGSDFKGIKWIQKAWAKVYRKQGKLRKALPKTITIINN
tara:strand:+ start:1093 stop:1614 length:522 start_codon:yes stop_codon:yes gene_type:complete